MAQNPRLPLMKVSDLEVGDYVDLEGDPFADPNDDIDLFAMELCRVDAIHGSGDWNDKGDWVLESRLVFFDNASSVNFPADHSVRVNRSGPSGIAKDEGA